MWIGSNCTIEKSQLEQTIIDDHVKIDDLVQIGHNSKIKKFTQIAAGAIICGRAEIGEGCWLAPNSVISDGCKIGENCFVGALSYVKNNFPKNSILVGVTSDLSGKITYGGRVKPEGKIIKPNGLIQKAKYINGNFVLIPKNVFNKIGYIDKKYSHALGDIDYGLRAKKAGVNIFISSTIIGNCSSNDARSYKSICETLSKEKNLIKRIKKLNAPLILPFKEYYYFNRKHFYLFKTIKFIVSYTLLILFPRLYFKLKQRV